MTEISKAELAKAHEWRIRHNWTYRELAALTGYSVASVTWFMQGKTVQRDGAPPTTVAPQAWKRFKQLCELLELKSRDPDREEFDW